jgi:hypothetical protein
LRVTFGRSPDGRRTKLYADGLARRDVVSFNFSARGRVLEPCEIPVAKVIDLLSRLCRHHPTRYPSRVIPLRTTVV